MRSRQLHDALEKLTKAIREVEAVVETMRAEHDPLASHISFHAAITGTPTTQRREAPRDERATEFQHSLRAGFSREFGRMGAVDGCSCASVAHAYEVRRAKDHRGADRFRFLNAE